MKKLLLSLCLFFSFSLFAENELQQANERSLQRLHNALSQVEPLQVQLPHDTKIQFTLDKKDGILIQVRTPKDSISLIFDTGAGFSSVTKSVAERLGIRILVDSIIGGGGTGYIEYVSFGVADTLFVGDILYKNVIFAIMEDESFTWPEIDYYIHGTLGFPEIKVLPSIKIHNKTNVLEVFSTAPELQESNMKFNQNNQMIITVNDSLLFF